MSPQYLFFSVSQLQGYKQACNTMPDILTWMLGIQTLVFRPEHTCSLSHFPPTFFPFLKFFIRFYLLCVWDHDHAMVCIRG